MQHHSTTEPYFPENLDDHAPWVAEHGLIAPYGKCQCGYGEDAPIAGQSRQSRGQVLRKPVRYVLHHQPKSNPSARLPIDESTLPPGTRAIPLTRGKFAIVDAVDYERLSQHNWIASESEFTWYAKRRGSPGSPNVCLHRVVLNAPDDMLVDHIDRNGLNNVRSNLRLATHQGNMQNRRLPRNNTSGIRGVWFYAKKKKWRAQINVNGKRIHLGTFASKEEAAAAYDAAAIELHGEFAVTNGVIE